MCPPVRAAPASSSPAACAASRSPPATISSTLTAGFSVSRQIRDEVGTNSLRSYVYVDVHLRRAQSPAANTHHDAATCAPSGRVRADGAADGGTDPALDRLGLPAGRPPAGPRLAAHARRL